MNVTATSPDSVRSARIGALDGLRGVAAAVVVVYHFICMFLPQFAAKMGPTTHSVAHYPVAILWNGPFAVSIFFVLSGFVMSVAVSRRADLLLANCVSRYVRLTVPIVASVVLAWSFLTLLPTATLVLQAQLDNPSRWLNFTFQHDIPSLFYAVWDGLFLNFVNGFSRFNNVLWTMQIELIGSFIIFFIYYLGNSNFSRLMICVSIAIVIIVAAREFYYLAFISGLLIYEFCHRRKISPLAPALPMAALVVGIVLGGPGEGAHAVWGLPLAPFGVQSLEIGRDDGLVPVVAATLILYAVVNLPWLSRIFTTAIPSFLGRVSFPLYLVHVPLLYTWVAFAYVHLAPPLIVLFVAYAAVTLVLAFLVTLCVEEPALTLSRRVRELLTGATRGTSASSAAP